MKKINTDISLHVDKIYLKGDYEEDALRDREILIMDGFLVVSGATEGAPVVWYNMDVVHSLVNVTVPKPPKKPDIVWL